MVNPIRLKILKKHYSLQKMNKQDVYCYKSDNLA
jgi:hypothetical protein